MKNYTSYLEWKLSKGQAQNGVIFGSCLADSRLSLHAYKYVTSAD